jgi:hypothetical protein
MCEDVSEGWNEEHEESAAGSVRLDVQEAATLAIFALAYY